MTGRPALRLALPLLLLLVAAWLWSAAMAGPATAFGPICGLHQGAGPHCWRCFAAAALALAGLAGLGLPRFHLARR